jgi:hypothetical protein
VIWIVLGGLCLLLAGAYVVSLRVHPWVACRRCKGGRVHGAFWSRAFGECGACGGRGRRPRLGVRVFQRERASLLDGRKRKG